MKMEHEEIVGEVLLELNNRKSAYLYELMDSIAEKNPEKEAQVKYAVVQLISRRLVKFSKDYRVDATFPQAGLSVEMGMLITKAAIMRLMKDGKERASTEIASRLSSLSSEGIVYCACRELIGSGRLYVSVKKISGIFDLLRIEQVATPENTKSAASIPTNSATLKNEKRITAKEMAKESFSCLLRMLDLVDGYGGSGTKAPTVNTILNAADALVYICQEMKCSPGGIRVSVTKDGSFVLFDVRGPSDRTAEIWVNEKDVSCFCEGQSCEWQREVKTDIDIESAVRWILTGKLGGFHDLFNGLDLPEIKNEKLTPEQLEAISNEDLDSGEENDLCEYVI